MLRPSSSDYRGQHHLAELTVARAARPGSLIRAEVREDSPGTWETRSVPPDKRGFRVTGGRRPRTSRPVLIPSLGSGAGETNKERGWWYCQAKETKCGRMALGSLSTGIVPMTTANPTRGEPEEGRAVSGLWNCCWETRGMHCNP